MTARFEPHQYATMLNASGDHAVDGGLIHTWTGTSLYSHFWRLH